MQIVSDLYYDNYTKVCLEYVGVPCNYTVVDCTMDQLRIIEMPQYFSCKDTKDYMILFAYIPNKMG